MKNDKANFDYSDLKDLIDQMSKNEKRYFSVNTSLQLRHGENNFLKLFKAFSAHPDKDVQEIEEKIIPSIEIKNLAETKYQLFNLLLKNLHAYHIDSSIENEIQTHIHYIEITYSKSLFSISNKLLQKAWEKAEKNETLTLLLILLQWKTKLNKNNTTVTGEIIKQEATILKQLTNLNKYNQVKEELRSRVINYGGKVKNKEDEKKLKNFYENNSILTDEKNAQSFTALCQHHLINSAYYYCLDKTKEALYHSKQLIAILREKPELRLLSGELYISNLQNAILFSIHLKNFREVELLLKELEDFTPRQLSLELQKSIWVASGYILQGMRSGKVDESLSRVKDFEKVFYETEKSNFPLPERYTLAYEIAHLYFIHEQYKNCLKWLNHILNERNQIRQDVTCSAQILFLVTHYELQNADYVAGAITNTYRLLRKKQSVTKTEDLFLKFLQKSSTVTSGKEAKESMKILLNEIEELYINDTLEKEASKYFDYRAWLKSKIEGFPFKKLVKKFSEEI